MAKHLAGNPTPPPIGTPCPVCGSRKYALCFDHDHTTKRHRGWLCNQCNRAIGQLGDNLAGLMAAVNYLTNAPTEIENKPNQETI
jgi:hypothetical protein